MGTLPTLAAALGLSIAAGAATSLLLPRPAALPPPAPAGLELEALHTELRALREESRRELAALREEVSAQRSRRQARAPAPTDRPAPDPEAAQGPPASSAPKGGVPEPFDVAAALARLVDPATSWEEGEKLWKQAREAGQVKALIKAFEDRAKAEPYNPQAHSELGEAYSQMAAANGNSPEAALWAIKADKSYDKALELDEKHWEARFNKAISLSFWPPVFGKAGEAIRQFETLLAQQQAAAASPEHAYTYYFLGNLYSQQGKQEKAREIWSQGAALFPGNRELAEQMRAQPR